ncbi:MAG: FAD-binding protein [Candidatus Latescibacteria bacterium]|nr:FAD-binding protein [Candidatus Latescibacterota bacterium]
MIPQRVVDELIHIVGHDSVITSETERRTYECDGYTVEKVIPGVVVLPRTTEQVAGVVKLGRQERIPFVPRGAGTGLSGGNLPLADGIMIGLNRMNRILEIDLDNRIAVVEPGVVNLKLTEEVASFGYSYAPDPSSQQACTIGGNVAENSGGPHTLKYGVTTNHVLGVELVLPDGEVVQIGGKACDPLGYDLTGVVVGSEGTLGIVTKVIVRLSRQPEAYKTLLAIFETIDDASNAVSGIIAGGIIPAALEMMDSLIIQAVEAAFGYGFPKGAGAALIIELDGLRAGLDELAERVTRLCQENRARDVRVAATEEERKLLWASRKRAFGAIGRLSPSYCTQDGVVPRSRLPEMMRKVVEIGQHYNLRIANVFHAGDGNLHPITLFDERDVEEVERVLEAGRAILKACVDVGGSLTGEHGIGVEKIAQLPLVFTNDDLAAMWDLKMVFDPEQVCNPGKIFPTPRFCSETRTPRRVAVC